MLNIWYYLDEKMNDFANFLDNKINIKYLANHCQSNVIKSNKDKIIYKEISEIFNITNFERKVIENSAYQKDFIPNSHNILIPSYNPITEKIRQEFIKETNIDINEMMWTTEEILKLHHFKNDSKKMDQLYSIMNYYHKQHFLMSIGVRN